MLSLSQHVGRAAPSAMPKIGRPCAVSYPIVASAQATFIVPYDICMNGTAARMRSGKCQMPHEAPWRTVLQDATSMIASTASPLHKRYPAERRAELVRGRRASPAAEFAVCGSLGPMLVETSREGSRQPCRRPRSVHPPATPRASSASQATGPSWRRWCGSSRPRRSSRPTPPARRACRAPQVSSSAVRQVAARCHST